MSHRLMTYNRGYTTRSCRQQCFFGNATTVPMENVLRRAAVSADGHEVARDFTHDREDNSRLHSYEILQQQIIGGTVQSVEDIEKWLRCKSEHISNLQSNVKNNSQAGQESGLNVQLSEEVSDKGLLTDIELAAMKLNIDYDATLSEIQSNKVAPVSETDHQLILSDSCLNELIRTQEIQNRYSPLQILDTYIIFENSIEKSDKYVCDVEKTIETAIVENAIESVTMNQEFKNTKTDMINYVHRNSFDTALTMSIQDLSIENDSSDGSSDPNSCTENESNSNKSEKLNSAVVAQKKSTKYNTRSKSTNSPSVKSKFQPCESKRKRKGNNEENTAEVEKNNTVSSNTLLHEKTLNENGKTFTSKSPRSSISEYSGSESDDLHKGRHPSFVTGQEFIISKALEEVGITENSLEYFYNSDNMKTWRCHLKGCGRDFPKLCYLKNHLMTHMNVKPFKCDYSGCSWAFYSEFKLKRHKKTHLNKKDYVCPEPGCERRFTTNQNLASHQKLHARPDKISCQVPDCTAKFQTKRALENHMKCHDDSLAPYPCSYEHCSKRFYTSNALMTHRRSHSHSENDLTCSWPGCGKTFDQRCRKKEHMRTHTGQKPYPCTFKGCGWAFSTASKLKRHQKKHDNDRNFVCGEKGCDKAFMRLEHLREHELTHTEEMNYQCHYCGAGFPARSSLYFHIKHRVGKKCEHTPKPKKTENAKKKKTRPTGNRRKNSIGSSGSESTSTEESESISVTSNITEMPIANVILRKMYKCPIEFCSKWYSHRSSLHVHLRKHTSPLSEIQHGNEVDLDEATTLNPPNPKPNGGAARTEFTCNYVLSLKPDRQATGKNEVGTVELTEGLLFNKSLPSVYYNEHDGLPAYQILLLDTSTIDGMQVVV